MILETECAIKPLLTRQPGDRREANKHACERNTEQLHDVTFFVMPDFMQKNQARSYEQGCATSLFVLHLLWGPVLLASAGHAFGVRCFCLSGKEFADVIQFVS